jgi:predicted O-linked N-acetylglucosamine transferase (SPINDLY family)
MQADSGTTISQAVRHLQAGQPEQARALLESACDGNDADANTWFLYGASLHQLARLEDALSAFAHAARLTPDNPQAWSAQAAVLLDMKRPAEALDASNAALALAPSDPEVIHNIACVREELGQYDTALEGYQRALEHEPGYLPSLLNLSLLHARFQRLDSAQAAARETLERHPDEPEAWYVFGDICFALLRPKEALSAFERAIALKPSHLPSLMGKAMALSGLARFDEAYEILRKVQETDAAFYASYKSPLPADYLETSLARDPRRMYCAIQFQRLERCDWSERGAFQDVVRTLIAHPERFPLPLKDVSLPHPALALDLDADERRALAAQVAEGVKAEAQRLALPFKSSRPPCGEKRLRIGYVSPDFRRHATAFLARQLFGAHDRQGFEVLAYALHSGDGSAVEMSIRNGCDIYRQAANMDSAALVRQIRDDRLDILVDLAGYTRHARPELFAARCAPLQVGYLGFPGTLGGDALDYAIVDDVVCPDNRERFWSESLVRLPGTYAIYDDRTAVVATTTRAEHGLPTDGLVMCCFNTAWKINPEVFSVWMRLLRRLPRSVLWLWSANSFVPDNLRREARLAGVAPDRLVFAGPLDHAAHLARYPLADLFLDTLPCNAHTTAADALWMGVPVVTALGAQMQGRVAASLLRAAELPDLIAGGLAEYESLVCRLATERGVLLAFRARLAEYRRSGALFNTRRKVRHLERAYRMMWDRHCRGLPPAGFVVPADEAA